jgi:hypothetical protein
MTSSSTGFQWNGNRSGFCLTVVTLHVSMMLDVSKVFSYRSFYNDKVDFSLFPSWPRLLEKTWTAAHPSQMCPLSLLTLTDLRAR